MSNNSSNSSNKPSGDQGNINKVLVLEVETDILYFVYPSLTARYREQLLPVSHRD